MRPAVEHTPPTLLLRALGPVMRPKGERQAMLAPEHSFCEDLMAFVSSIGKRVAQPTKFLVLLIRTRTPRRSCAYSELGLGSRASQLSRARAARAHSNPGNYWKQ